MWSVGSARSVRRSIPARASAGRRAVAGLQAAWATRGPGCEPPVHMRVKWEQEPGAGWVAVFAPLSPLKGLV